MQKSRAENISLIILFVVAAVLLFFVFAPLISILALAAVFAILLHTPYKLLTRRFNGWKNLSATITVIAMLVLVVVPIFFLGWQISQEAQNLYADMSGNGAQYLRDVQQAIQNPIRQIVPGFTFNIYTYVGNTLIAISNNLGSLAYQTLYVVFETFLMLLALFFFLRDGRTMLAELVDVSPLGRETTQEVLDRMCQTIGAVIKGTVLNALIRFGLIWVAFALFNIPNAILWSSIGGIVGAIPGLGTPFAFLPAVAYLYLGGNALGALGLALFGIAVVILVDNILTSYFFGKGLQVPPLFVLFSILGGVIFFGPLGFILGPLVLSVFVSVVRVHGLAEREA